MTNKRWTIIFKALANNNRLAIIKLLADGRQRHVTNISEAIHLSIAATSRHLIMLSNLDVLDCIGKAEHVFYYLNPNLPADIKKALELFVV